MPTYKAFHPKDNKLLILPFPEDEKTEGGILVANSDKKPMFGTCIAAGPGVMKEDGSRFPMSTSVGECVMFSIYAGTQIKVAGQKVLVMTDADIFGSLEVE
jgi:chaperonin GroES